MEESKPLTIVVYGDSGAGKTSFITRLAYNIFTPEQASTIKAKNIEASIAGHQFYIWDLPSDRASQHSFPHDCASDLQLITNATYANLAKLFMFVWDASKPAAPIKEFHNRLKWMQEHGIDIQNIPMVFVASKSDIARDYLTPKEIDENIVRVFGLKKVRYITTSAKENWGFDKCGKAVDDLLLLSQQAKVVHALELDYQATKFSHTRAQRFAQLKSSDIVKKNPTELTDLETDWLLLNWQSINDRNSTVSLWIEKRLACKFGIYTDPAQPYTEQHRQEFDQHIQAKETGTASQEELQPLRQPDFAETQQKFQKVHLLLVLLATYETSKLVKLASFFFKCYRESVKQYKIGLMTSAKLMFDGIKQNKTNEAISEDLTKEWGEIPKEVGRIVDLAR